ncbi:MAG: hypothetical protein JOY99_17015 [Sphingomonadaceae bacterium]|nr:hypothetical protein [Sphingomonadaceae bacterium]
MATAPDHQALRRASPATASQHCSEGQHTVSRASIRKDGDAVTGRCTRCGCRLVKNMVMRAWYVSGLMG